MTSSDPTPAPRPPLPDEAREHLADCWECQNDKHCPWREWGCGQDGHVISDTCTCAESGWCGESSEAGCCFCLHSDPYDPCPVFGFGCGFGAPSDQPGCDCCEPEQYAAAQEGGER
jgi:hypothetical protein